MKEKPVLDRLLDQRIRNAFMTYLELAASPENQRAYKRDVSIAQVPAEMICQWDDLIPPDGLDNLLSQLGSTFSLEERQAIRAFNEVWSQTSAALSDQMPDGVEKLLGTPIWDKFIIAAEEALKPFNSRGRFSNEVEGAPF